MSEGLLVAVDDGYAQIKIYGENPSGGAPVRQVLRTSVKAGRYGLSSMDGGQSMDAYRTEEGEDYSVSENVVAENTQFDSFHISQLNRVLVTHGLSRAGYDGKTVMLTAGLPVADYFSGDSIDETKISAKEDNLLKRVTRLTDTGPLPVIGQVEIGCQAVAAWYDFVLDDALQQRVNVKDRIAIVDIGGRTTDIATIFGGETIDQSMSGTANHGVLDVYKILRDQIRGAYKIRDEFPLSVLDSAVRTGKLPLWGKDEDVSALVASSVAEIETKIGREIERRLGSAATLSAVVFVGGGGALFTNVAGRFRNGKTAEDPEFSNARGLFKYARLRQQQA